MTGSTLITGGSFEERREYALSLASGVLCGTPDDRRVKEFLHTDLVRIFGNKVSDVRILRDEAYKLPSEGESRVMLIEDADMLGDAAQNALLKVLEEPPKGIFFVLTSENADKLLPTVLSRCTRYRLGVNESGAVSDACKNRYEAFSKALQSESELTLWEYVWENQKLSKDELSELLGYICALGLNAFSFFDISKRAYLLRLCLDAYSLCERNVTAAHILGGIAADLFTKFETR